MSALTVTQMHRGIRLGLQQVDAYARDGYRPEEIDYYINKAIHSYIKSQYSLLKSANSQFAPVMENLRTLITYQTYSSFTDSSKIPLARRVTLPTNPKYLYFVHSHVQMNSERRVCKLSSFLELESYLSTQVNPVPWFETVPLIIYEDEIHILRERAEDTISNLSFVFVREPAKVAKSPAQDCDLPAHTHEEIVELTIEIMLMDVTQRQRQAQPE